MQVETPSSPDANALAHQLHSRLAPVVLDVLRAHPAGVPEVAMLRALEAAGIRGFARTERASPHALFRCHFLLFHVLYALRERLPAAEALDIDCRRIRLRPAGPATDAARRTASLQAADPLRQYYLDLANLHVDEADVEALLAGFWRRIGTQMKPGERAEALAALELSDPVDAELIKRRYRALAMQRHPDRGGSTQALQRLNAALAVLLPR